jgi:hypothetical protein
LGYIGVQFALALEGSSVLTFAGQRLYGEAIIPAWPIQADKRPAQLLHRGDSTSLLWGHP